MNNVIGCSVVQDTNNEDSKQQKLIDKGDAISNLVIEMFGEIKAGTFNPERLIELQVIHFENNGEVDDLFKSILQSNESYSETPKVQAVADFTNNFHDCEHVQTQMQEWAEEDLTQEAEDNRNESAAEARDCEY